MAVKDIQYTLEELAKITKSKIQGDNNFTVSGINTLDSAKSNDISFLANPRYAEAMKSSNAGVICIDEKTSPESGKNYLICNDPSRTFQQIVELFKQNAAKSGFTGIHPTAVIHETASIGENVNIGPFCAIDANTTISSGTSLVSHVHIGPNVTVGTDCFLHPHTSVRENCQIGNRVTLQPGAVIGSCGFGYTLNGIGQFDKITQIGNVVLEDDVEIGANTTIDRARFQETRICKGSKIDNLVQIAHNVKIGPHNAIAAQTGIAGSAETGSHVMMGGQVGIVGHVKVASMTQLATRSGVSKSMKSGKYRGSPCMDVGQYNRQKIHVKRLESYSERIKSLEQEIQELKSNHTQPPSEK